MPKNKDGDAKGNVYLESGDVLLNGFEVYVGNSGHASNDAEIKWLQKTLGSNYKVHTIKLDKKVFHLDCAMMLLNDKLGVRCKKEIKSELPNSLLKHKWVETTPAEAKIMETNGCIPNSKTVIMDAHHPDLAEEIRMRNHIVIEIPYTAGKPWAVVKITSGEYIKVRAFTFM